LGRLDADKITGHPLNVRVIAESLVIILVAPRDQEASEFGEGNAAEETEATSLNVTSELVGLLGEGSDGLGSGGVDGRLEWSRHDGKVSERC